MFKNILIPVSFDEEEKTARALDLARQVGDADTRVTLLHVVERVPVYVASYIPDDYLSESRAEIEKDLAEKAAEVPNAHAAVVEGHAGSGILNFLEENGVDLVIIASHRPGVQDYFLGGTAAHVVRHAKCSVHVVR